MVSRVVISLAFLIVRLSNYICLKKRGAKAQLFLFVNRFAQAGALRVLLEERLHLREASRERGLFFGREPVERGIDHLAMEQLVSAVGLPAFFGERHKHLSQACQ